MTHGVIVMLYSGFSGSLRPLAMMCKHVYIAHNVGTPKTGRVGRAGQGRHPGCACKGQTKGLSLTERRLSFGFAETTPRLEALVLRLTVLRN